MSQDLTQFDSSPKQGLPGISVVLAVRDGADSLERCLLSVLSQSTDHDLQLVVVDDGSVDRSGDILRELEVTDHRVKVHRLRQSRGIAQALTVGVNLSDHEYIARIDHDDVMLEGRLRKQATLLDEDGDVVIVSSYVSCQFEQGVSLRFQSEVNNFEQRRRQWALAGCPTADLINSNLLHHSEVMYRASTYDTVGGYVDWMSGAEDYDLWLRMVNYGSVAIIPEILTSRSISAEGLTGRFGTLMHLKAKAAQILRSDNVARRETIVQELCREFDKMYLK